ncbi:MAG TPA: VWA domain-containing protein [Terriglobales bacterium]|nr:VWA domain-containing protein [Terriglobales bacterium]
MAGQIAALEHYLSIAENGILKQDALEVLIWDYTRTGSVEHVRQRAQDLLRLDPGNPVAVAALGAPAVAPVKRKHEPPDKAAKQELGAINAALQRLEKLRKPEGMVEGDFAALRRHVEAQLEGALGMVYVAHEQYQQAKTPLQQAAANDPNNAQYAYGLGLSLLLAKDDDPGRAYFYLARAAGLAHGTPQGQQIADFARKSYLKDGGKDADWNRFMIAAAPPKQQPAPSAIANQPPPPTGLGAGSIAAAPAKPSTVVTVTPGPTPSPSPQPSQVAVLTPPDVERTPVRPAPTPRPPVISSPNPPLTLGILIETALLTKENRPMIVAELREVVRHLRPGDEACILVFSNQLDFEQDLTPNEELLTEAMEKLQPKSGTALADGVGFAAGHLKRIGKNPTRVLLVISDGRSAKSNPESPALSAQIQGVRVDVIGLNVQDESGQAMLQGLASFSGGKAIFVEGPQQFRTAAAQMTYAMGISAQ